MTALSELIGMQEHEACRILSDESRPWTAVRYRSFKPEDDWDSVRVVRAREQTGVVELITCEFKTSVS